MSEQELYIHRHTGGLETDKAKNAQQDDIHRHTGGLENHTPPALAIV